MVSVVNKIRTFISRFKDINFRKGVSTFIGAVLINTLAGTIYSLCTLAIYEISYVKAKGGSINIDHLSFYYPIEIIFQCFSSIVSGIIYKELGLHVTNLIGITILCLGYFLMYISKSLSLDLLAMVMGGIGTGIILYPSTTNSYKWFMDHSGIIMGIMETMNSFGSFFFSFIGEKIINNDQVESNDEDNLYPIEIGKKVKTYLLMQIITLVIVFFLSLILMYEKKEDKEEKDIMDDIEKTSDVLGDEKNTDGDGETNTGEKSEDKDSNKEKNEEEVRRASSGEVNIEENDKNDKNQNNEEPKKEEKNSGEGEDGENLENNETLKIEEEKKKEEKKVEEPKRKNSKKSKKEKSDQEKDYILNIEDDDDEEEKKQRPLLSKKGKGGDYDIDEKDIKLLSILRFALKSKRLILFGAIVILQAPVSNMAFTLYREIGEYKKIDIKYLQLVGSLYFIFECLSGFVFGLLCDYIQLKYLLFCINAIGTFTGFVYCLTFKNGFIFFMLQNLLSFSAGGYYPIKDCYLMKVFGDEIYIELSGYVSFLVALTINLLTPINYVVQSNISNKEVGYWILFVSFGVLNLIGLIINIFIKETPLDLKDAYIDEKGSKSLSISLNYFHNSFKNSFHTSFHKV